MKLGAVYYTLKGFKPVRLIKEKVIHNRILYYYVSDATRPNDGWANNSDIKKTLYCIKNFLVK